MELFAPDNLPGVGMGDLQSVVAICGLLGLAVTSGALLTEGAVGAVVFTISALWVLQHKPDLGGAPGLALLVLALMLVAVALRRLLEFRADRDARALVGAVPDAPETRAASGAVQRRRRWSRRLALLTAVAAGASTGFAWAEWNEVPFRLEDAEAFAGIGIGIVAAAIGGDAAWRFLQGAIRAGGDVTVVGVVVSLVALAANVASVYLPFAGAVVLLLALLLALRLRSRQRERFAGLRILS